jgi:RNA polymerase sigma-70 factor (ECF subfamily)
MPNASPLHLVEDPAAEAATLVARAAGGDRRAQEQLYRQNVQFVGHVAHAAGAGADLEDVVQETFINAFAHLAGLTTAQALRPWLARLTVRQVQRRARFRPWLTLFTGEKDEAVAWETMVDRSASAEVVQGVREAQAALSTVDASARLCWLLRHWHGMTLEETAVAADVSLATAKRRLQKAEEAMDRYREEAAR